MCEQCFSHLHVHTDASRIDGLGHVDRLVSAAKSLGFSELAMTDHGTLANSVSFTASCEEHGIKPILGMEAYVGLNGKRFHLTLLADGNAGFKTLVELNNAGQKSGDGQRPTFPLELLRKHNAGLVVLTGCPASPMQSLDWPDARQIALELKDVFGPNLFAEVMFVAQSAPWVRSQQLVTDLGLKPVVTNDVHFAFSNDAAAHKILVEMKAKFTYESEKLFLATRDQLKARVMDMAPGFLKLFEAGANNAHRLASKLSVVKFSSTPKLPHVANAHATLERMAKTGLLDYGLTGDARYEDRLAYELSVIKDMDFATYFIILADIIQFARRSDIKIGPGRGSGAGSLVLWLIGCTEIDPIFYGLSFDRFLNRQRKEMPDVDTDIEAEHRPEIIDYAMKKWGALPVATYARYSHKSLVHDLSRVLRVTRADDTAAADGGEESPAFKKLLNDVPDFKATYDACIGQIRHVGQHAGGVVIVDEKEPVPLERTSTGDVVVGWTEGEKRELTRAGIVKFDLLGLTALSVIARLERQFKFKAPDPIDDSPVFKLFRNGDLLGIFQFAGSQGIIDFTRRVSPRKFEDLVAINALYRPGALDSGAAKMYPEWRKAPRLLHPLIDDILAPTYGVICYQEQFMEIFARITGGDMSDADLARKVLSKARPGQPEWESKMATLLSKFSEGITARGIDPSIGKKIWDEINTHTRYSFNRSHSVAYAMVSWQMAWWKFHHRTEFFAALLTVDKGEWERYLFDVIASGVEVVAPHVNTSTEEFVADGGKLYLPLNVVKFLGPTGMQAIIDQQPFTSFDDFMARVPKRAVSGRARQGLWNLGAFTGIPGDKTTLGVVDESGLTIEQLQEKSMGISLPSVDFLKQINDGAKKGFLVGTITSKEKRKSGYGEYTVFKMMPQGAFWTRDYHWIEPGMRLKVKIRQSNGKIVTAEKLA